MEGRLPGLNTLHPLLVIEHVRPGVEVTPFQPLNPQQQLCLSRFLLIDLVVSVHASPYVTFLGVIVMSLLWQLFLAQREGALFVWLSHS